MQLQWSPGTTHAFCIYLLQYLSLANRKPCIPTEEEGSCIQGNKTGFPSLKGKREEYHYLEHNKIQFCTQAHYPIWPASISSLKVWCLPINEEATFAAFFYHPLSKGTTELEQPWVTFFLLVTSLCFPYNKRSRSILVGYLLGRIH